MGIVVLSKGQRIVFDEDVKTYLIGLGRKLNHIPGNDYVDVDTFVFLLGANGQVRTDGDFLYYCNIADPSMAVQLAGLDPPIGERGRDDDRVFIDFSKIPSDVAKVLIAVIFSENDFNKSFVRQFYDYVRILKACEGEAEPFKEIACCDLDFQVSEEKVMVVCEIERSGKEWSFVALGKGYACEVSDLCKKYGINVD